VQRPAASAINSVLQLHSSLPTQLNVGDSTQAQVLALREAQHAFQVLLRLSLPNGQQRTIEVQSNQPLAPGNILNVTALSAQQLAFSLVPAAQTAIATRIDTALLAPGTLLEAKVVQVTPSTQGGFKITVSINNSALAGQQLQIDSPKSLPLNSQLNARIDSAQQLTFQPLNTRLEPLAINQELQKQFNQQGSFSQLFQGLNTISPSNLSPDAQRTLQQLLGSMPELSQMLDPKKLAQSLTNSGAQLENRLLSGALENANHDVKANLLRLIAQIMPMLPNSNPTLAASQSVLLSQALPGLLRDQLLGSGQAQLREQALRFPLPTRVLQALDNPNDLGSLLRLAAAAVSRLQTHQLASLGQTHTNSEGTQVTVWQVEIPTRDQHNIVPLQIKFQHEEPAQKKSGEPATPVWKIDLSFDLEPLGPLHIQASLQGGSISSHLWAQNTATANLIDHELGHLRDRLLAIGLTVKDLTCHQGVPPQGEKTTLQQRWIDDLA
jgi:hypothetical protein